LVFFFFVRFESEFDEMFDEGVAFLARALNNNCKQIKTFPQASPESLEALTKPILYTKNPKKEKPHIYIIDNSLDQNC